MAIARSTPKCEFCNRPIAKGIYSSQKGIPYFLQTIGDTFMGWEYKDCKCKKAKKWRKQLRKEAKQINEDYKNRIKPNKG